MLILHGGETPPSHYTNRPAPPEGGIKKMARQAHHHMAICQSKLVEDLAALHIR